MHRYQSSLLAQVSTLLALAAVLAPSCLPCVSAAACASAPAIPAGCYSANSCSTGDACNVCAPDYWLSDAAAGTCSSCRNETAAAHAHAAGTVNCSAGGAFYFQACRPWGAVADAHCAPCDAACSNCTADSADKDLGCTRCAAGYYDDNGLHREGGVCLVIMTEAPTPLLKSAAAFAVLGASTVTNTGPSIVTGDFGLSPGSAITGIPPGIIVGVVHATDTAAAAAASDAAVAYAALAGRAAHVTLSGTNLGGLTLAPAVYKFATSALLTGTLTLDAQGDVNAEFVFQIGSSFTADPNAAVTLIGGARSCNVYWQVSSSATLGTGVAFAGTFISYASVSLATGASLDGRAIGLNGAVTLDNNKVTVPTCEGASCAGPYYLVPASGGEPAQCMPCNNSCSSCTAATANKTTGCTSCSFGHYDSNSVGSAGGECLQCRSEAVAAEAFASGTTTCNAGGSASYFRGCSEGTANASTDAMCVAVTSEAQLSQIQSSSSGGSTCSSAGAFFFEPATATSDASCTPCNIACSQCTTRSADKRAGCQTCALGYFDSNSDGVGGGSCGLTECQSGGGVRGYAVSHDDATGINTCVACAANEWSDGVTCTACSLLMGNCAECSSSTDWYVPRACAGVARGWGWCTPCCCT